MKTFRPRYKYCISEGGDIQVDVKATDISSFGTDLLNLGDIRSPSQPIDVLAVLFDLEGFTNFTRQVDPQLTTPLFLSDFLEWLFKALKKQLIRDEKRGALWAEFPFFGKFMGDGVLFLWRINLDKIIQIDRSLPSNDLQSMIQQFITNIVASIFEVCQDYNGFVKMVETQHVDPPSRLRCGIARGIVIPIGNWKDFVGPCINIAARLQKFNELSFAFSARGIDSHAFNPSYGRFFIKKRVSIRGIGENELVYVLKEEFEQLPSELKIEFNIP